MYRTLLVISVLISLANTKIVQTGKFFSVAVEPTFFNWTSDVSEEYKYSASLVKAPDLPEWMHYAYSRRDRKGFLYGVVPHEFNDFDILVVAMNRRTYETRKRVVHLNVLKNSNPGAHQVHLKIDNVNVEELFDPYRMTRLLDIFKDKLWPNSFADLHVTFMASAVTQGARRPLKPNEGEGVVIRLGSSAGYSGKLLDLQEEVKPLWKLQSCPRDFKRTTVERWFRDEGFILDWCSFKLMGVLRNEEIKSEWVPPLDTGSSLWEGTSRSAVPSRSYSAELAFSLLVPALVLLILIFMLSFVLCFTHEQLGEETDRFLENLLVPCEEYKLRSKKEEESEEQLTHYVAVHRATSTLRSLSRPRDVTPDPIMMLAPCDDVTRPTPPPYTGTLRQDKRDM